MTLVQTFIIHYNLYVWLNHTHLNQIQADMYDKTQKSIIHIFSSNIQKIVYKSGNWLLVFCSSI